MLMEEAAVDVYSYFYSFISSCSPYSILTPSLPMPYPPHSFLIFSLHSLILCIIHSSYSFLSHFPCSIVLFIPSLSFPSMHHLYTILTLSIPIRHPSHTFLTPFCRSFTGLGHPREPRPLHSYAKLRRPHLSRLPHPQHSVTHVADAPRRDPHHGHRHLHRHQYPLLCRWKHRQNMGPQEVSAEGCGSGGSGWRVWEKRD